MKHSLVSFGLVSIALAGCGGKVESAPAPDVSIQDVGEKVAAKETTACPKPSAEVAGAFAIVDAPQTGSIADYLEQHKVAKEDRNERCETLYFRSIYARNEDARQYLLSLGYAPENAIEGDPLLKLSVNNYIARYGSTTAINTLLGNRTWMDRDVLTQAVIGNTREVIEWLLKQAKPELDIGDNLLVTAIENRRPLSILRILVNAGAPVKVSSYTELYVESPLQVAARVGHQDAVALLLSKRVPVNRGIDGQTLRAIFAAVAADQPEIVAMLAEAGANLNATLPLGPAERDFFDSFASYISPLTYAQLNGKSRAAAALANYGAQALRFSPFTVSTGISPIRPNVQRAFDLVEAGDVAGLRAHLDRVAIAPDAPNAAGETLYAAALRTNRIPMITALEEIGYGTNSRTILSDMLVAKTVKREFGRHWTEEGIHQSILSRLFATATRETIDYVSVRDENGIGEKRALWDGYLPAGLVAIAAGENRDAGFRDFLLSKFSFSTNMSSTDYEAKKAVLGAAIAGDQPDWIRAAVAKGVEVDTVVGNWDETALMIAASSNRLECVRVLLELGADKARKSMVSQKTAYDYAKSANARQEVLDLLK